jgi:hypothetical protein
MIRQPDEVCCAQTAEHWHPQELIHIANKLLQCLHNAEQNAMRTRTK